MKDRRELLEVILFFHEKFIENPFFFQNFFLKLIRKERKYV